VFGVGGDSGSSMSTTVVSWIMPIITVNRRWCGRRLPWCSISPFSVTTLSCAIISRAPRIYLLCLQWGQRQSDPYKPAKYVFSCVYLHTHPLARASLSGVKYPIHLASLHPQNLRKPMESSVPSSELLSRCPLVILVLKTTNLTTKTLASLNNSEQEPRFCRL
jgi:hypothetical protein